MIRVGQTGSSDPIILRSNRRGFYLSVRLWRGRLVFALGPTYRNAVRFHRYAA